jgi:hypothetical protein
MKYRKLRIAWTVACGVLCLLLIVLWVRSQTLKDSIAIRITADRGLTLASTPGVVWIKLWTDTTNFATRRWSYSVERSNKWWESVGANYGNDFRQAAFEIVMGWIKIPYWLLTPFAALLAIVPWFRWRFSLRTLFMLLGVIVYSMR